MAHASLVRRLHARSIQRKLAAIRYSAVLHFAGELHLPLPAARSAVSRPHFLYADATWSYWADAKKFGARYVQDADEASGKVYRAMTRIFAISEFCKGQLVERYHVPADRVSVVGTGRGAIKPASGKKEPGMILFVARQRFDDKGGPLLLTAFQRAVNRNPDLKLVIVGDKRLAAETSGTPGLTVHEFLALEDLQKLFERASLYAMPAAREPWGLVYLEALACQTPIVGLARGAFPEISGGGRFGSSPREDTADALADTLLDAFSDPARLARMGREGQEHVLEHFTWERVVDRMLIHIDSKRTPGESRFEN